MDTSPKTAPKIFISYSHKDEIWKDKLISHLGLLMREGRVNVWNDRQIKPGDEWNKEIEKAIHEAKIAIMIISVDYLNSDFIRGEEVPILLDKRKTEGMRLIPLIAWPCGWKRVPWLKDLQAHPFNGVPLSAGDDHHIANNLTHLVDVLDDMFHEEIEAAKAEPDAPHTHTYLSRLPETGRELFGREKELTFLNKIWADHHTRILVLEAWGGVGKSALVNEWLNDMQHHHYRGARRAYGWSFYSQGTREERQASADEFLAHALKMFGDEDPAKGSAWDKGVRLAELIQKKPTLLILDGLEPLQYVPGPMGGRLKDQGMLALLKELARSPNGHVLCVISTRMKLKELEQMEGNSVHAVALDNLLPVDGAALLNHLGVMGSEKELEEASADFKGHALSLTLLGGYLAAVHHGDVQKRHQLPPLEEEERQGKHARRVMQAYETWLKGKPQLDILYLMGLFDRPAEAGAINVLRTDPAIQGLTNALQPLSQVQWQYAIDHLRNLGLVEDKDVDPDQPVALDCHPLVREHFGERLRKEYPEAWKEAHNRLYEYYRHLPEKQHPDTLEEMAPLFAAIPHGCWAGRHQETLDDVYYERILRKGEAYINKQLGAFGMDLAAVACFFESPWDKPAPGLVDTAKAGVLNWAAFGLRALGRLRESLQPFQASLDQYVAQKNWEFSANASGSLSQLLLTLGQLQKGVDYGRRSIDYADRSGDGSRMESERTALADALHQAGKIKEAEELLREAEEMQEKRQPENSFLYSVKGFRFCDLLLSKGEWLEVQKRAGKALEIAEQNNQLLSIALDRLSLGRAALSQAQEEGTDLSTAGALLNQAVDGLREAGTQHYLPLGLLARATFFRETKEFDLAQRDLTEVLEIAERGEMKLHLADCWLEFTRLLWDQGKKDPARKSLKKARELVEKTGYGRREEEASELEKKLM